MKKIVTLTTLALVLSACGSHPSQPSGIEQGMINLSFYRVGSEQVKSQDIGSERTTNIVVRIHNPTTGFNVVRDVAVAESGAISVPVPATSGYTVEALSYYRSSYSPIFVKYGEQSDISVAPNTATPVRLTLARPQIQITLPDSVVAGEKFTLELSGVPSYFSWCYLQVTNTPKQTLDNFYSSTSGHNGKYVMNAPEYTAGGRMYAYANCVYEAKRMNWETADRAYFYNPMPNLELGETAAATKLNPASGAIDIGIGY